MSQLMQPQEVEVFYILPAIRKELAVAMKQAGKPQKEIAKLLHVEESTISQYLTGKRASMMLGDEITNAAKEAAKRITSKTSLIEETQKLLILAKQNKSICTLHIALAKLPKSCDICFKVKP
jgi:predicted transcriptional regulator